mmetsp:Transcript_143109/g.274907  ORF Transcript_143109/g.274907 Transcript_143109/m.274907 type:complete len:201 (+) Transcript_143109:1060-1662(+)
MRPSASSSAKCPSICNGLNRHWPRRSSRGPHCLARLRTLNDEPVQMLPASEARPSALGSACSASSAALAALARICSSSSCRAFTCGGTYGTTQRRFLSSHVESSLQVHFPLLRRQTHRRDELASASSSEPTGFEEVVCTATMRWPAAPPLRACGGTYFDVSCRLDCNQALSSEHVHRPLRRKHVHVRSAAGAGSSNLSSH